MSDAPVRVNELPIVTMTNADSIPVWDAESGIQGRATVAALTTLLQATLASLSGGNTFAGTQIFANSVQIASTGYFLMSPGDFGAGTGRIMTIDRNSNASTPAPGSVACRRPTGVFTSIWPDDSGVWRTANINGATSVEANTATVVGSQSSSLDVKDLLPGEMTIEDVLAAIAQGAAAVRRFVYKPAGGGYDDEGNWIEGTRPYNSEVFEGVIVDYAGRYGTDRDETHPNGKSLNTINATGDLLRAVAWLVERVGELEQRIAALES